MNRLAKLAGKRRCCLRGVCIHRQAKAAADKIAQLQADVQWLLAYSKVPLTITRDFAAEDKEAAIRKRAARAAEGGE